MEDKIRKLVDALITGTTNGKISWQVTERQDEYSTKLDNGAITVDLWDAFDEVEDPISLVDIAFLNILGEQVDRVVFGLVSDPHDFRRLAELHKLAKRSYLKIDATLDNMLGELERKIT